MCLEKEMWLSEKKIEPHCVFHFRANRIYLMYKLNEKAICQIGFDEATKI